MPEQPPGGQLADRTATAAPCCGEHPPGKAGAPLVLACQLCPRSPTYWRRDREETPCR